MPPACCGRPLKEGLAPPLLISTGAMSPKRTFLKLSNRCFNTGASQPLTSDALCYGICFALWPLLLMAPFVRPISVAFRTPRQEDFERYTIEGQELRQAKMPPDEAIYAIGDLFHKLVTDPHERLIVCGLAIMLATGFRVGEVLTLPLDCEVTEGRGQRRRYGLRFHKEKSIGGQKQLAVRWMTPKQAELAKAAAAELRRLTTRGSQASKDSRVPTRNGASPGCTSECGFESRASGCVSWVPAPERNVPSRNSPAEAFCERLARCHLQGKRCHEVPAFDSGPVVGRGPSGRHAPTAVGNAIHPVPQCGSRDA